MAWYTWHLDEFKTLRTEPHQVAGGFAIGTFIAILPTFGLGALLGLLIILLFKNVNKMALFSAFAVWNPFVLVPLYGVAYAIGDALFQSSPVVSYEIPFLYQLFHLTRRLLVGNFILALALSLVSYVIIFIILRTRSNHT
jgi:uncharacterized protein